MYSDPDAESDRLANHELIHLHRLEIIASAFPWSLRVFTAVHCLIGVAQTALFVMLIAALVQDWDHVCSQPLHVWVMIDLAQNFYQVLHGIIFNVLRCGITSRWAQSYDKATLTTVALFSTVWDVIGAYWVFNSDGCEDTAPRLHATAKAYIIFALSLTGFMIIDAIGLYTFLTRLAEFDFIEVDGAAPPGTLERLKVVEFEEGSSEFRDSPECCICMADFAQGSEVRTTPCGHLFHGRCLGNWLKINRTCPLCRSDVVQQLQPPEAGGGPAAATVGRPGAPAAASPRPAGAAPGAATAALSCSRAFGCRGSLAAAAAAPEEPPEALAGGAGPRLPGEPRAPPEAV